MTSTNSKLHDAIRLALVGAASFAAAGTAVAQEEATTLDRVEVTGSRIKRVDAETSQPVFSLSRDEIQAQGLTSVGDVIQNLTSNGSTLNTTNNNGGNGETRVNLRNLGSNRTLVLVNGRRWIGGTGLGGAVDLNTIPTAAVERIEVLKDGASVIYGSDAISGVVNVILRTDMDGAEANGYYGQFSEGDGERYSADFTVGATGDRFSGLFGIGFVDESPVSAGDRAISAQPTFGAPGIGVSGSTPDGQFGLGGTSSANVRRPDGSLGTFTTPNGAANWQPFTTGYNFAPENYLLTPQERVSFFSKGHVDITDTIRFSATAIYNERLSEQLLASMPVSLGLATSSAQARAITISQNSIYNPYGQDVTFIARRFSESGGRSFKQDVNTFAFTGWFDGTFELGDRYFSWDAGYFYGKNDQSDTTDGLFNLINLKNALGPSEVRNGTPVCLNAPGGTVISGCVPLNLLGGFGTITPDMLNYTAFQAHDNLGYELKYYFANLTGDLFELPAGMAQFAFGAEKRFEEGFDQPDALINAGQTTGNARRGTAGGYDLEEAYVEFQVPLLADAAFAELLDFSLAARTSDYSNFGDTTNMKAGFRWKPYTDLMVRGNYSEGFRAPSILELFRGRGDSFPPISDPCANKIGTGAANPYAALSAEQQARCQAQGVPAGGYVQTNPQIRITLGGNPDLQPETSETKTLGFVYSPNFVEGLDLSLDWWNIRIEDAITNATGQTIVNNCILLGQAQSCGLITRGSGGVILDLLSSGLNQTVLESEGFDFTVNYRLPETAWGTFSFNWDTAYTTKYELNDNGNDLVGEYLDRDNHWRIRSNLMTRWQMGDFGATWFTRFYSKQDEVCPTVIANNANFRGLCTNPDRVVNAPIGNPSPTGTPTRAPENRLGGTTYHDLTVYWNAPWNAKITLGLNNAFDKDPPVSYATFANSFDPQYEVPGRFYYVQYNQRF